MAFAFATKQCQESELIRSIANAQLKQETITNRLAKLVVDQSMPTHQLATIISEKNQMEKELTNLANTIMILKQDLTQLRMTISREESERNVKQQHEEQIAKSIDTNTDIGQPFNIHILEEPKTKTKNEFHPATALYKTPDTREIFYDGLGNGLLEQVNATPMDSVIKKKNKYDPSTAMFKMPQYDGQGEEETCLHKEKEQDGLIFISSHKEGMDMEYKQIMTKLKRKRESEEAQGTAAGTMSKVPWIEKEIPDRSVSTVFTV